jgi:predicted AAA+ superfamily ATPase
MTKHPTDLFDQLNPWWSAANFRFKLQNRPDYTNQIFSQKGRLIQVLLGGRRVGKTSILNTVVNEYLSRGIKPKHIIFLAGELREVQTKGIRDTITTLISRLGVRASSELHIFIDEVQEIKDWQTDVKLLYDATPYRLYLSGSSSLLLAKQTVKLTGRYYLRHVLPLSFGEFLTFKGVKAKSSATTTDNALDEYLRIGGYPEYVMNNDPAYLRQCIESTLYRELMSAYGMRNPALLQDLLYFLADAMTNEVSAKKIKSELKIDDKTAHFYLRYLQDVFLIYPTFKAGRSNRITKGSNPKYYFNDTGVLALTAKTFRIGHAVENVVFLKLLREQPSQEVPRIEYSLIDGQEVDFVFRDQAYEVKARTEITEDVLEKYSELGQEISMITLGDTRKFRDVSSSLKVIPLKEFLLRPMVFTDKLRR